MFDRNKVQQFITKYLRNSLQRYNVTNPRQIKGRDFLLIKSHLWHDMEMANLVPLGTGNPQRRKPENEGIYNEVEQMIGEIWQTLPAQETYGESVKKLGKKVMALHECSKKGMTKKGYAMFKEAMASLMTLEGNGCKSEVLEKAKAILAEYYDTYKSQIKKDTTRVIVESKAEDAAKKAEDKRQADLKTQLKSLVSELTSNVGENNNSAMRRAVKAGNYELISFHADQLIKIASKIKAITNEEINDFLE